MVSVFSQQYHHPNFVDESEKSVHAAVASKCCANVDRSLLSVLPEHFLVFVDVHWSSLNTAVFDSSCLSLLLRHED